MKPIGLGAQIDGGDLLAIARPLPAAHRAGMQAACAVQAVHVERPAGFHRIAAQSTAPPRPEAAHHAPPFFPKSSRKPAGGVKFAELRPTRPAGRTWPRNAPNAGLPPSCQPASPAMLPLPHVPALN